MNAMQRRQHSRVAEHTDPRVNDRIQRATAASIYFYAENPDLIPRRIRELDAEWDIERALQTLSSSLTLTGLVMATRRPRWLILPLAVQGFFLQHSIQGWCPPLAALRRAGFRTPEEIEHERTTLLSIFAESKGDGRRSRRGERETEMKPVEPNPASHDGA
ncbi:MAG: hypothetical protein ACTS27_01245 [Phycisphaerales bacterium]